MLIETDYYSVTYTYVVTDPEGGSYSYEYLGSSYMFIDDGGGGGGGGGLSGGDYSNIGGGGSAAVSKVKPTSTFTEFRGDAPIANVAAYIKCFNGNLNASYSVTLCVDQPNPGSRDPYTSGNSGIGFSVGHTFLEFQQNVGGYITTRAMGLYPSGNVTPVSPVSKGSLNNDEGHGYSVSLTINTTGAQFMSILNACANGNNVNYNINTNNCSTWALSSLAAGGVNITTTPGDWPFGGGDDPGDLGQDIRSMPLS